MKCIDVRVVEALPQSLESQENEQLGDPTSVFKEYEE